MRFLLGTFGLGAATGGPKGWPGYATAYPKQPTPAHPTSNRPAPSHERRHTAGKKTRLPSAPDSSRSHAASRVASARGSPPLDLGVAPSPSTLAALPRPAQVAGGRTPARRAGRQSPPSLQLAQFAALSACFFGAFFRRGSEHGVPIRRRDAAVAGVGSVPAGLLPREVRGGEE